MNKLKDIFNTVIFCAFIAVFSFLCITHKAEASSEAERRPLAQMPALTLSSVENGVFFDKFDDYTVDQFPMRDFFRSVKAHFQMSVLGTKENNSLALENGSIAKIEKELNTSSLKNAAKKLGFIYDTYLKGTNTRNFLSIVPDKSYFFSEEYSYPSVDFDAITDHMTGELSFFHYIDIFPELSLDAYYKTDTHWSQEKIGPVVQKIADEMGFEAADSDSYTVNSFYPFRGVYYGQSALSPEPDTLFYLTNDIIDSCTVYDYETKRESSIYSLDRLSGSDAYDVFLSGSKALLRIDNPNCKNGRQLIIFRDSYGSSLAPLLIEGYSSITLVDTRYVSPLYLEKYIEFDDQDVLFIYSTLLLNNSFAFK